MFTAPISCWYMSGVSRPVVVQNPDSETVQV